MTGVYEKNSYFCSRCGITWDSNTGIMCQCSGTWRWLIQADSGNLDSVAFDGVVVQWRDGGYNGLPPFMKAQDNG